MLFNDTSAQFKPFSVLYNKRCVLYRVVTDLLVCNYQYMELLFISYYKAVWLC